MIGVRAKISMAFFVAIAIVANTTSPSLAQIPQSDIYFAKQIWTGIGEPIDDAAMVVVDGKIIAVGPRGNVAEPRSAVRHELDSRVIIPGLIAAQTNLSGAADEDRTLTPQIRAVDGFDFFADRGDLLKSGITTVQIATGQSRLMSGVGGVVQLAGEEINHRILSEQESLQIVLSASSRNPPRIYEPPVGPVSNDRPLLATRPQLATLTASLAGLRQIFKQTNAKTSSDSINGPDEVIDAVAELITARTPIRITAKTTPEIRGAISLAREFDLDIVLVDCVGLKPFAKSFKDWNPFVKGVVLSGFTPGQISNPTPAQIKNQKRAMGVRPRANRRRNTRFDPHTNRFRPCTVDVCCRPIHARRFDGDRATGLNHQPASRVDGGRQRSWLTRKRQTC